MLASLLLTISCIIHSCFSFLLLSTALPPCYDVTFPEPSVAQGARSKEKGAWESFNLSCQSRYETRINTMEYVWNHKLHNWIVHAVFKWLGKKNKKENLSSYQVTLNKLNLICSAPSVTLSCLGVGFWCCWKTIDNLYNHLLGEILP